jgi:hypothetical protein
MAGAGLAARLPDIDTVRAWSVALAVADAVLCEDPGLRCFTFDAARGPAGPRASYADGSGNDWSITFLPAGAYLRGFDHESPLSPWTRDPVSPWPGLLEHVPAQLQPAVADPADLVDGVLQVTVSLWRLTSDASWHAGAVEDPPADVVSLWADPDGSNSLFEQLDGEPDSYVAYAEEYFEQSVDRRAVAAVFAREPLSEDLVRRLAPERSWQSVAAEVAAWGHPVA